MIWSDSDFLAAKEAGLFDCNPWRPEDLTPNGLDLRIASVLVPSVSEDAQTEGTVVVPPMARFVIGTEETLTMPITAVGSLWIRSSYARKGAIASFGKVDAGFCGNLTLGMVNVSPDPLELVIGDRCAQIVLEDLKSPPTASYADKSGNYQNQTGITLAKS